MYHYFWEYSVKKYPFIPILTSFGVGITIAYWLPGHRLISFRLGIGALVARCLIALIPQRKKTFFLLFIQYSAILLLLCASGYYWLEKSNPLHNPTHIGHFLPTIQAYEGVVLSPSTQRHRNWVAVMKVQRMQIANQWRKATGKVQISGWGGKNIPYGTHLYIRGAPTAIPIPLNPHMTNWQLFKQVKGIEHTHYLKKKDYSFQKKSLPYSFQQQLHTWREQARQLLLKNIEDPAIASILVAMLLGVRTALEEEVQSLYSQTGVMHILAISGLHVGLIYYFLLLLLYWLSFLLPFLQRYTQRIALAALGVYVVLTGAAPPVLRAWGMLLFWQIGKWLKRDIVPTNLLAFIAFLLLMYNPYWLFSISFQLSFAAATAIVCLYLPCITYFQDQQTSSIDYLRQTTLLSLAILLGTWPFSIYYFHTISFYSFLGNALIMPFATLILLLGFALLISSHYSSLLAAQISQLLKWLFTLLHHSLRLIQSLPCAYMKEIFLPLGTIVTLYIGLIASWHALIYPKKTYKYIAFISLLSGIGQWSYHQYQVWHHPPTIIIYSVAPHTVIGFFKKRKALLLVEGNIERHDSLFLQSIAPSLAARQIKHSQWLRWQDCLRQRRLQAREKGGIRSLTWQGIKINWLPKAIGPLPKNAHMPASTINIIPNEQVKWLSHHIIYPKNRLIVVTGKKEEIKQVAGAKLHWLAEKGALTIDAKQAHNN